MNFIKRFKAWRKEQKLFYLRRKLAGRMAARAALRINGQDNWGVAEDIGKLQFQIDYIQSKD